MNVLGVCSPEQVRYYVLSVPTTSVALPELSSLLETSHLFKEESCFLCPATILVVGEDPLVPLLEAFIAEGDRVLHKAIIGDEVPHGLVRIKNVLTKEVCAVRIYTIGVHHLAAAEAGYDILVGMDRPLHGKIELLVVLNAPERYLLAT